jgi:phospholipase/carboxylesterase
LLQTIDIETAANPSAAILWLHGLGADANDFVPIVPELVLPQERAWRFVFPNAPLRPVTINGGMRMRAWYDIKSFDRTEAEDLAGFRDTERHLRALIERENGRGIPSSRIVVGGFSQGGASSLYAAPRYTESLAGILALSCYLPIHERLAGERTAANQLTPIFMAHGRGDAVISMELAELSRKQLQNLGFAVEWHAYPMAHAVCPGEIADIRAFLLRVLP